MGVKFNVEPNETREEEEIMVRSLYRQQMGRNRCDSVSITINLKKLNKVA